MDSTELTLRMCNSEFVLCFGKDYFLEIGNEEGLK